MQVAAFDRAAGSVYGQEQALWQSADIVLINSLQTREHDVDAAHVAWMQTGAVVQSAENVLLCVVFVESSAHYGLLHLRCGRVRAGGTAQSREL